MKITITEEQFDTAVAELLALDEKAKGTAIAKYGTDSEERELIETISTHIAFMFFAMKMKLFLEVSPDGREEENSERTDFA